MNYYFITGSSKGIGKALVEELLNDENNIVYGISRSNSINAKNFTFIELDLSGISLVSLFRFPVIDKADELVLINNAGVIGDIKLVGDKNPLRISEAFNVNSVAPSILMNQFINQFQKIDCEKTIINISSGSGRHTVSSWAEYCASKSALDMFSMVAKEEQSNTRYPFNMYSVAPGIIDTEMQTEIRSAKSVDFDKLEYFKDLKEKGLLSLPENVAKKILLITKNPKSFDKVLLDVRDF